MILSVKMNGGLSVSEGGEILLSIFYAVGVGFSLGLRASIGLGA